MLTGSRKASPPFGIPLFIIPQIAHVLPEWERDRWPFDPSTDSGDAPRNHRSHLGEDPAPARLHNTEATTRRVVAAP